MTTAFPRSRLTAAFERRVQHALDAHVPRSAAVVVACSGGPDSLATLVAVARGRASGGAVIAATFDHGMRPAAETAADRETVEAVARRLGVQCVAGTAVDGEAGVSEADARLARYRWLAAASARLEVGYCVTGHTLDDQSETALMRLARGTGIGGIAAMAASAPWPVEVEAPAPRLVRPLLETRRPEVIAYLEAVGVEPRYDATNELVTFDRNRIRHRVLPELRAMNPRIDEAISRFAALARRDAEALDLWAQHEVERLVTVEAGEVRVVRAGLRALPPAVSSRVLREAARALELQLDAGQVETLLRVMQRRGSQLSLSGGQATVEDAAVVFRTRGL